MTSVFRSILIYCVTAVTVNVYINVKSPTKLTRFLMTLYNVSQDSARALRNYIEQVLAFGLIIKTVMCSLRKHS